MTDAAARGKTLRTTWLAGRSVAVAVAASACGLAAVSTPAVASPAHRSVVAESSHGHHGGRHHHHAHAKQTTIDGLVMSAHKNHVSVFASSSRVGHKTTHNNVVHLTFGHHPRELRRMHKGYEVHLVASAHGSARNLVVPKLRSAHVAPSMHGPQGGTTVTLGEGGSQIPLFVDGSTAATDQLRVGDRIIVLGEVSEDEEGFTPAVAFAFDGHDDGPCGDNPLPARHHNGD